MDEKQPQHSAEAPNQEASRPAQPEYYEPTTQEYQYKIFINECNGYIGSQLVELFRNDDEIEVNPNIIISTVDPNSKYHGELGVNKAIEMSDRRLLNAVAKQSDIIVFVLREGNEQDLEYLCKVLRKVSVGEGQAPRKKRFILVSSCLTWNGRRGNINTEPKLSNLASRNSTKSLWMELENLCLDMNNHNCGIQSFVVCSGLVYGYGEGQLFPIFKKALEQSGPIKILGKGTNTIPLIHLQDLSNIVKDISFQGYVGQKPRSNLKLPQSNYYFAVDFSTITQYQLLKGIAETMGNGEIKEEPVENCFLSTQFDQFTCNLKIEDIPELKSWHCRDGILSCFSQIVSEFNTYRGLKPNKIVIIGPPVSGKSKAADVLASAYGLPILSIKKVIQEIQKEEGSFAESIKVKIEEIRTAQVEQERKAFEDAKKKKKGKKDAVDEFDPTKVVARLPEQDLIAVFKHRLSKSDCQNKGYILDGWPKTAKSCSILFMNQNQQVNEALLPNSCFVMSGTDEEVKQRVKNLPAEQREGTHWTEEATARRLQAYAKSNQEGNPRSFFQGKVQIKEIPLTYTDQTVFVNFVERNGPLGFKKKEPKIQEAEVQPEEDKEAKQNEQVGQQQDRDEEQEQQEDEDLEVAAQNDDGEFDLEKLTEHEKQILNEKSRPIRQYLIDNVIPQITEGLLEICKDTPSDPIGFLIKFLQAKESSKPHN